MKTFKLITDSTADLSPEYIEAKDILELGMTITLDGVDYPTTGKDRLTNEILLEGLAKGKLATTSQINSGTFQTAFTELVKEGREVLYIAFSSGLSGTYQSANIAREMVLEDYPTAKITVVDSLAAASGEGFLVEEAVKLQEAGKSVAEIIAVIEDLKSRLQSWFMVDDLPQLARGGRISKTAATLGTLASIKPLLDVDAEGKLRAVSKVRGKKKAINNLIDSTLSELDSDYPRVIIGYSGDQEEAQKVKESFEVTGQVNEVVIRPLSPTIVTHTGSGTIAIFTIGKQAR